MLNKIFLRIKMVQKTCLQNSLLEKTAIPIGGKSNLRRVQEQELTKKCVMTM